jgi:hypothetical protein
LANFWMKRTQTKQNKKKDEWESNEEGERA